MPTRFVEYRRPSEPETWQDQIGDIHRGGRGLRRICKAIGPLLMRSVALLASVAGADITAWFAFTDAIPSSVRLLLIVTCSG